MAPLRCDPQGPRAGEWCGFLPFVGEEKGGGHVDDICKSLLLSVHRVFRSSAQFEMRRLKKSGKVVTFVDVRLSVTESAAWLPSCLRQFRQSVAVVTTQ